MGYPSVYLYRKEFNMNKGFICEYEQSGICYRKSCNRYPEQDCMKSEELLRRLTIVKKQQKMKFKKKRR